MSFTVTAQIEIHIEAKSMILDTHQRIDEVELTGRNCFSIVGDVMKNRKEKKAVVAKKQKQVHRVIWHQKN